MIAEPGSGDFGERHNDLPTVVTSNRTESKFALYHSRLKAAVHVHISAPDARGKVGRGAPVG